MEVSCVSDKENSVQKEDTHIDLEQNENNEALIPEENIDKMMKELKAETDGKQSLSTTEMIHSKTHTDEQFITHADIKKIKLFFVSDMDEEAGYLHEMSLKGLHFTRKEGIYYYFNKDEPCNYYYHLSYYEKGKRDSERYLSNYEEAGWKNIYHEKAEYDGIWNYFRIFIKDKDIVPDIFSDRVSRVDLYKRLLTSWRSLLAIILVCFLFMLFISYFLYTHPSSVTNIFIGISCIVILAVIATFVIYLRAYLRINKKLEELLNL